MRQPDELKGKLELASLDFGLPTLFIAECVLVYMGASHSGRMLAKLATWFNTAVFVNYEQVRVIIDASFTYFCEILKRYFFITLWEKFLDSI